MPNNSSGRVTFQGSVQWQLHFRRLQKRLDLYIQNTEALPCRRAEASKFSNDRHDALHIDQRLTKKIRRLFEILKRIIRQWPGLALGSISLGGIWGMTAGV
jgi:hypothetical protein